MTIKDLRPKLFLGLFSVTGLVLLVCGVWRVRAAFTTHWWPTADGVVLTSYVTSEDVEGEYDYTKYTVVLSYEYSVDGERHVGDALSLSSPYFFVEAQAEAARDRNPEGAPVVVYYDPDDPDISLLDPGVVFGPWFWLVLTGVILILMSSAMFWIMARGAPNERNPYYWG